MTSIVFSNKEYPTYSEREDMKSQGVRACTEDASLSLKAQLIVNCLIKAHYWRAREDIETLPKAKLTAKLKKIRGKNYYSGYVLDFDHYAENWLWANGYRTDLMDTGVLKEIENIFGYKPKESKYMGKGYSYYSNQLESNE